MSALHGFEIKIIDACCPTVPQHYKYHPSPEPWTEEYKGFILSIISTRIGEFIRRGAVGSSWAHYIMYLYAGTTIQSMAIICGNPQGSNKYS
jgi:hypothetical protein